MSSSEAVLKLGKKGEIYTSKEIRKKMGLKANQKLRATLSEDGKKLVIQALPSLEEILKRRPLVKMTSEEVEKISEREQKRRGIYGY